MVGCTPTAHAGSASSYAAVVCAALVSFGAGPVAAQDVELLGRIHGTTPPDGYYETVRSDPSAFRFSREGRDRLIHIQASRSGSFRDVVLQRMGPARTLGPRGEPVVGTFRFPLVLGLFADSPSAAAYDVAGIQREFFEGPNSYYQTIPELYEEMSMGLVTIEGATFDWVRTPLTRQQVTRGQSGLVSHQTEGVGGFIEAIVAELDSRGVDWSRFDHTGDGFVDVLTVMHPTHGAECQSGGASEIWSHRWTIQSATQGRLDQGIETATPRPDGAGFIRINDYTIQPVLACNGEDINQIGVFAHELGHGFGLPDLYGTAGSAHAGSGNWDLMGTGAWGCGWAPGDPARPCHMGAWTRAMLGWIEVQDVSLDTDHGTITLPPVAAEGRVLRVPAADGTDDYLLLENRQRSAGQELLLEPGMLVWHIDPVVVEAGWTQNRVNADPQRMGVRIRAADGRRDLEQTAGNRGDPGDPFPGCIKASPFEYGDPSIPCQENPRFHAGSTPASVSVSGQPLGITILDVERVGAEPFDIRMRLTTRRTRVTLTAELDGGPSPAPSFTVDDVAAAPGDRVVFSAPFQTHQIEASGGPAIAEGERAGFQGWDDGEPRIRAFTSGLRDTTLVARYGGREFRVDWVTQGGVDGVEPGALVADPFREDLWFAAGAEVSFEAKPTPGFAFRGWTGAFADRSNPFTAVVDAPFEVGAAFDLVYGFDDIAGELELEAAVPVSVRFDVSNGTEPVRWTLLDGELPVGLSLSPNTGRVNGAALVTGTFPVEVQARDDLGLTVTTAVTFVVTPPAIAEADLLGPFLGSGRGPTEEQRRFLDHGGNDNGTYDLGDLRAFLQAYPDMPAAAPSAPPVERVVPMGSFPRQRR